MVNTEALQEFTRKALSMTVECCGIWFWLTSPLKYAAAVEHFVKVHKLPMPDVEKALRARMNIPSSGEELERWVEEFVMKCTMNFVGCQVCEWMGNKIWYRIPEQEEEAIAHFCEAHGLPRREVENILRRR